MNKASVFFEVLALIIYLTLLLASSCCRCRSPSRCRRLVLFLFFVFCFVSFLAIIIVMLLLDIEERSCTMLGVDRKGGRGRQQGRRLRLVLDKKIRQPAA